MALFPSNMYYLQESKDDQLFMVVQTGDLTDLQILLESGPDVNAKNKHCDTALHLATWLNKLDMVEELINHGATADLTNENGQTALHLAADHGFTNIVQLLLENNCPINAKTKFTEMTALHLAAKNGHTAVVELLLENNVDCLATDVINKTAEFYAANGEIRQLLSKQTAFSHLLASKATAQLFNKPDPSSDDISAIPTDLIQQLDTTEIASAQTLASLNTNTDIQELAANTKDRSKKNAEEGLQSFTPIPFQKGQVPPTRQIKTTGKLSREHNTQQKVYNTKTQTRNVPNRGTNSNTTKVETTVSSMPSGKNIFSNAKTLQAPKASAKLANSGSNLQPPGTITSRRQSTSTTAENSTRTTLKPGLYTRRTSVASVTVPNRTPRDKLINARLRKETPLDTSKGLLDLKAPTTKNNAFEIDSNRMSLNSNTHTPNQSKVSSIHSNTTKIEATPTAQTSTKPQTSKVTSVTTNASALSNTVSNPKTKQQTSYPTTARTNVASTIQNVPISKSLNQGTKTGLTTNATNMYKRVAKGKPSETIHRKELASKMQTNVFDRLSGQKMTSQTMHVKKKASARINVGKKESKQKEKDPIIKELLECVTSSD